MRHALLAGYAAVCLLAITWPGYAALGVGPRPFVLGVPFVVVWNLGWVLASFGVLVLYHRAGRADRSARSRPSAGGRDEGAR